MRFERWQGRSPLEAFPVSIGLLGACLVLFVATDFAMPDGRGAALKDWAANRSMAFVLGEYWRPVTSIFMHGSLLHVALNMYALWQLCPLLERNIGSARFAAIYFGAGIAASLASMIFDRGSVGASGAIFGVVGCYIRFERVKLGSFKAVMRDPGSKQLVTWVLINIFLGLGINQVTAAAGGPGISNAAHLGGLFGGWAISAAVLPALGGFQRGQFADRPSPLKLAAFLAALAGLASVSVFNRWNAGDLAAAAFAASVHGHERRALELVEKARHAPFARDPEEFFAYGAAEHKEGREKVAAAFYSLAMDAGFRGPELGHNQAILIKKRGDDRELLRHLQRWKELGIPLPEWEERRKDLESREARGELGR